jgi:hypothetical protein
MDGDTGTTGELPETTATAAAPDRRPSRKTVLRAALAASVAAPIALMGVPAPARP